MIKFLFIFLSFFLTPAFAEDDTLGMSWDNFYFKNKTVSENITFSDENVCVFHILEAQKKYSIPNNLLLAIAIQESGRQINNGILTAWPWTVNSNGKGRWFKSKIDALEWLQLRQSEGIKSNDIGCMQINLRWHPDAFDGPSKGFDPSVNVDYSARLLKSLYDDAGDWWEAAGRYHSFTEDKKNIYLNNLKRNMRFANVTYNYFEKLANTNIGNLKPSQRNIMWSSWLTSKINDNEGSFSIYSNQELKPILPSFDYYEEQ